MTFTDLLLSQISDPFRIGLLIALGFTTLQTSAQTGRLIPLLLGAVFVSVLIANTTSAGESDMTMAIGVGVLANAIILAVLVGLYLAWKRMSARPDE